MTYNLKKTASTVADYVVDNHKINTETMISLIGKSYVGYGDELQQNTIDLLCNFHTQYTDYSKAIPGQLIYDGTNLKLCTGENYFINLLLLPCDNGANSPPTGEVTITGTVGVGQTLTASNTIKDSDGIEGAISYEWFLNGASVGTGSTYIPTSAGSLIVKASYKDGMNNNESLNSATKTIPAYNNKLTWSISSPFAETAANDGTIMGELTIDAHNSTFSNTYPYTTTTGKSGLLKLIDVKDVLDNNITISVIDSTVVTRTNTKLVIKVIFKTTGEYDFTSGSFILHSDAVTY
jgi:hypothetical protein